MISNVDSIKIRALAPVDNASKLGPKYLKSVRSNHPNMLDGCLGPSVSSGAFLKSGCSAIGSARALGA
jgi:hypothetical protein